MPNGVQTSDLVISSAVSELSNMLAPLSAFSSNITNEVVGRHANVKVPVLSTDDTARVYASDTGYTASSDTALTTITVALNEQIKPFHLNDNDLNKSPLSLQAYARQNANEFGRHLMNLCYDAIGAGSGFANEAVVEADSVAISDIATMHAKLDEKGAPMDRHLVLAGGASNNLLPNTIETFGNNVLESGRFQNLYGMQCHVTNAHDALKDGAGVSQAVPHSFACSSDSIVYVSRMPEVSGTQTLEEYTPFTIDGLGIQCAYRRFYDASKGIHYGAFTAMFGVALVKPIHIAVLNQA